MRICKSLFLILALMLTFGLAAQDHQPGTLIVQLDSDVSPRATTTGRSQLDAVLVQHNLKSLKSLLPTHLGTHQAARQQAGLDRFVVLSFPTQSNLDQIAHALRNVPGVVSVERDVIGAGAAIPADTSFDSQWNLENTGQTGGTVDADVDALAAWDLTTGSSTIVVAVLDTGIDSDHPDFAGRIVAGYDTVNEDNDPEGDHYHGTACAGIIAANANNNFAIAGIDWNAKIMPVKVLDANNAGTTTNLIEGLTFAADNQADVISMSLINYSCSSPSLQSALQYARTAGSIVISSAGNNGIDNADTSGPGCYPETISVGATDRYDARSSFSATGNALTLVAPGTSTVTVAYNKINDSTSLFSGTSAAAPHVAGAASLMLSLDPTLTHEQVQALLETSSDDMVGPSADDPAGWDDWFGWGRLNLGEVVFAVTNPVLRRGSVSPRTMPLNQTATFSVIFTSTSGATPDYLDLVLSGPESGTYPMTAATAGHPVLIDGDTSNGELYQASLTLTTDGDYLFHVLGSASGVSDRLPATGDLTGPKVLNVLAEDVALSSTIIESTLSGEPLSNTHGNDGSTYTVGEVITSGGKPSNRYSTLEHEFLFQVLGGDQVTFQVKARKSFDSSENDDFEFAWSTDGNKYTSMVTITDTSYPVGDYLSFEMPAGTNGQVWVRIMDTNSTPGFQTIERVIIDHMVFRSEGSGGCTMPVANFSTDVVSGLAPLDVQFTDSTSATPDTWSWQFGDGGTSTLQNPNYTYITAGTYTVTLQASNSCGSNQVVQTDLITVTTSGGGTALHVASQSVTRVAAGGPNYLAENLVVVHDQTGSPVAGVTVNADFSGPTSGSVSGITNSFGEVVLQSGKTRKNLGAQWCFTITDLTLSGATYDSGANASTTACE